jgi:hypothetical protein
VGEHRDLWLYPPEHLSGFHSIRMVLGDCLRLPTSLAGAW